MMKLKLFTFFAIGIMLCALLTGCGFHAQTPNDIPLQLRRIYLYSPNPYIPLTVQLRRILTSLNVRFTTTAKGAPVTLRIIDNKMTANIPTILYSGNANSYTYTLVTDIEIAKRNGKIIYGPKRLSISRSLLQNVNQLYTPNASALMKRELTHTMVTLIYNHITSLKTRHALQKAFSNKS